MPWPTVPVVTTGMDADTDTLPRTDILDHAQKFNQLIAMRAVADGVCDLDSSALIPSARLPAVYQPLDDQLTTLAGITAQQATDLASLSTFMGTVLNDPDDATARATLGVVGKNKIINGGFAINQRVYVSGTATTVGQYTLDRWKVTSAGGITFSTTANKTTVTIPAGQTIQQVIEGLNLQSGTYTLSWEGTAQGKIGAGSLSASGVTGSITGGTDTTIEFGPGTVANVQLEFGSVATPFEHRPYGTELALCQRYYEKSYAIGTAPATATTTDMVQEWVVSGAGAYQSSGVRFTQEKRALPTITIYSSATGATGVAAAVVAAADKTTTLEGTGTKGTCPYFGLAAADLMRYHWTASAEF